jgi:hypothetical protein
VVVVVVLVVWWCKINKYSIMGGTRKLKQLSNHDSFICNEETGKCVKKPKLSSSPKKTRKLATFVGKPVAKASMGKPVAKASMGKPLAKASMGKPLAKDHKGKPLAKAAKATRMVFNKVSNYKKDNSSQKLQLCSLSSFCISFGLHSEDIFTFFDNFSWKYIDETKQIQKIGEVSANGFNYVIPFKHEKYTAYCVLKSSIEKISDNLKYEACVGNFVNKLHRRFPIFMHTYRFGKYSDAITFLKMKNDLMNITTKLFKLDKHHRHNFAKDLRKIEMTPISEFASSSDKDMAQIINDSCVKSEYNCILTEHIPTSVTLTEFMTYKHDTPHFWEFDIVNILFQIYSVLSQISDVFTHYDLHSSNVLLYLSQEENVCVELRYHLPGNEIVTIYTKYIAKVIDYGRCFFYDDENMNSKKYHDLVCKAHDCQPDCGEGFGYEILNKNTNEDFITPQKRNQSHDLRLWNIIVKNLLNKREDACPKYVSDVLRQIYYKGEYGTPESKNYLEHNRVATVQDAYISLLRLVKKSEFKALNTKMVAATQMRKIGVLDIWLDDTETPMRMG